MSFFVLSFCLDTNIFVWACKNKVIVWAFSELIFVTVFSSKLFIPNAPPLEQNFDPLCAQVMQNPFMLELSFPTLKGGFLFFPRNVSYPVTLHSRSVIPVVQNKNYSIVESNISNLTYQEVSFRKQEGFPSFQENPIQSQSELAAIEALLKLKDEQGRISKVPVKRFGERSISRLKVPEDKISQVTESIESSEKREKKKYYQKVSRGVLKQST